MIINEEPSQIKQKSTLKVKFDFNSTTLRDFVSRRDVIARLRLPRKKYDEKTELSKYLNFLGLRTKFMADAGRPNEFYSFKELETYKIKHEDIVNYIFKPNFSKLTLEIFAEAKANINIKQYLDIHAIDAFISRGCNFENPRYLLGKC